MKSGNDNIDNPSNGWQNLGKVTLWVMDKLNSNELHLYLAIARRTVGYTQYTSEITSYALLAELTGISTRTIERTMPKLIESGYIIKVATNQVTNVGKLAYRYQLNMQLDGFPSLGKLRKEREDSKPKSKYPQAILERYFVSPVDGSIQPRYLPNAVTNPRWFSEVLSVDGVPVYPTAEELSTYLTSQEV